MRDVKHFSQGLCKKGGRKLTKALNVLHIDIIGIVNML